MWAKGSKQAVEWERWVRVRSRRSLEGIWSRVEARVSWIYICFLCGDWEGEWEEQEAWRGPVGRLCSSAGGIWGWMWSRCDVVWRQTYLALLIVLWGKAPLAPGVFVGRGKIPISLPNFLGVVCTWHLLPHLPAPLASSRPASAPGSLVTSCNPTHLLVLWHQTLLRPFPSVTILLWPPWHHFV